jgi:integrase
MIAAGQTDLMARPRLEELIPAVLGGLAPATCRVYAMRLRQFLTWCLRFNRALERSTVRRYVDTAGLCDSAANQALAAIKHLAKEAAERNWLDWSTAQQIAGIGGRRQRGVRAGNWLSAQQAQQMLRAVDRTTLRGARDYCALALLLGCGLRRQEAAKLEVAHLQQREGRWYIVDLRGKGGRIRTIALSAWVWEAIVDWLGAAGIEQGYVLRSFKRKGKGRKGEDNGNSN